MAHILLVLTAIRDSGTRSLVRAALTGAGHKVVESSDDRQAQLLLSSGLDPDIVFVECVPPDASQTAPRLQLLDCAPRHKMCFIFGMGDHQSRKELSDAGIVHFLMKPTTRGDIESIIDKLSHLSTHRALGNSVPFFPELHFPEAATLSEAKMAARPPKILLEELGDNRFFLAASPNMLEIYRQVSLLADVNVPVLILGESGTGKEVIARLIHKLSPRFEERFLNVNCAALPVDLLESELFGHRQGAFTGALRDRPGKLEQANQGTILLDEIGEIGVHLQAKLLHVLQDGQFTRLGGQETTKVDVRILAATNIDMETALLEKTFREDLYYRLNTFTIKVPPLRERREEIPYLIEETIRRTPNEAKNYSGFRFSSRLMDAAVHYEWRGNLRELCNFVTRTLVMKDQDSAIRELEMKIAALDVSRVQNSSHVAPFHRPAMKSLIRDVKNRTEATMIQDALETSGWNRRRAAKDLNISYRGLLYKINQHRLTPRPRSYQVDVAQKSHFAMNSGISGETAPRQLQSHDLLLP